MKSPAYHPESNGQAERIVRLVKDVLKKFLLDPEIRRLDTDEQISYFLMNYRNICLGPDNAFPSERLLSYKPKTTLDLINPKHTFKYNLTESNNDHQIACSTNTDSTHDLLTNLRKGDLLYYKNPNKTDIRQWLSATFLMQISPNVLQISLGGRIVSAHRRQIKIPEGSRRRPSRRFVFSGESPSTSAQCSSNSNNNSDNENTDNTSHSKKRKRSEEDGSDYSDSDFYGFAADSFLFEEEQRPENCFESPSNVAHSKCINDVLRRTTKHNHADESVPTPEGNGCRRSKRKVKKRKKHDYLYY